jgi:hypothetical protein
MNLMFMFLQTLQTGSGNVIQDIWNIMKAHPNEAVVIFLVLFIGLVLFFKFVINRMSPYILIVVAVIAFVLTALLLYGIYQPSTSNASFIIVCFQTLRAR